MFGQDQYIEITEEIQNVLDEYSYLDYSEDSESIKGKNNEKLNASNFLILPVGDQLRQTLADTTFCLFFDHLHKYKAYIASNFRKKIRATRFA